MSQPSSTGSPTCTTSSTAWKVTQWRILTASSMGKRMKNGWKNSAPWGYDVDPEKIILEEGSLLTFEAAGLASAFSLALEHGTTEGTRGDHLAIAPTLRLYVVPNRISLAATPVLVRVGALAGRPVAADVAAVAALGFDFGRLELSVMSPPLSYISRDRWHTLPIAFRLGLFFD